MLSKNAVFRTSRIMTTRMYSRSSLLLANDKIIRIGTEDPRMSNVVQYQGVVYTSGQTDTSADDIVGQTRAVLAKIDDLLAQAGTDKKNLLTAQIWLKDIDRDFAPMNQVWSQWLDPHHKPVRATVEAPMARPSILVEIQVTAATSAGPGKI